ncbi:MAG TPA: hypothetical protein VNA88_01175 [Candidatus Kapabacteria bacterium]|nr:hypothetical protein [Candidatus Kapabacteria bacterium]
MRPSVRILLPLVMLVGGCATLGGGDITTMRAVAQGRYDAITTASLVLDRLIAQPAPSNLTPTQRVAWDAQTNWLTRTKSRLLSLNTNLRRVLDSPHPSGTGIDGVLEGAQLASDYARVGEDFAALMAELTVEREEDERRVAEAEGMAARASDSTRADSLRRSGGIALSTPLKARHDAASEALSSVS